ncbi:hypothetical protein MTR67_051369 [Solanum verrucosum]|uniref:Uncharacterized protein n=1 Tax=Solanum verrucosum TaxID=315347 RepID=A0AAF0V639_SOLVR|nr:hypothetical protein MTR67_051369 [Solanum verrucosum]
MRESLEKVKLIRENLLATHSRQREYAYMKVKDLQFMEGEKVLMKVSPMKRVVRSGKRGAHSVFHVSIMEKYHGDGNYIIHWDLVLLNENLAYEEEHMAILDREVRKLRSKDFICEGPVEESIG